MRFSKDKIKHKYLDTFIIGCNRLWMLICIIFCVTFFSCNSFASDAPSETAAELDPATIKFPERTTELPIVGLRSPLQRHDNGRIKTFFETAVAWQIGRDALSLANEFSEGSYVAEGGIKITMISEEGTPELWIDAEKACVFVNKKIGKCFGFVKVETPDFYMSGTNLLWNAASTNLLTIENNVVLKLKNLNTDILKGTK